MHEAREKVGVDVVVGMSGGVDSSVAALLLRDQGYRVTGLFMKNWEEDDTANYCAAAEDLADAQAICDRLAVPLRTINFSTEYWDRVFERFLAEYRAGLTPNPDILCNREIKFKEFLDHAQTLGAQHIATGHYAGSREGNGRWRLLRARDGNKDQSYFLYTLGQRALSRTLFPLAGRCKDEVRRLARDNGFPVHAKKDSTGICFIGERRFKEFLSRYLKPSPGDIIDVGGNRVGRHDGLMYYTLGQRQGLGIGGPGGAWYVTGKRIEDNLLVVAQGRDHAALMSRWLRAGELSWTAGESPPMPYRCSAKIRYRQADQACVIESSDDGAIEVRFDAPQRAVTPGQAVVFYAADECLGGGTIQTAQATETAGIAAA